MDINEKVAYLKGLMEGLGFKPETPEQKVIASVVDILEDLAGSVTDLEGDMDYALDYIEELDADLGEVEEFVYTGPDDDYFDDEYYDDDDEYFDDEDDDYDFDDDDDEDEEVYEFECPECGNKFYFTNELADKQEIICPACQKRLTFDADTSDDE